MFAMVLRGFFNLNQSVIIFKIVCRRFVLHDFSRSLSLCGQIGSIYMETREKDVDATSDPKLATSE